MSQARLPRTEPSTELITAHKGNNCDAHAALQTRDFSALPKHRAQPHFALKVRQLDGYPVRAQSAAQCAPRVQGWKRIYPFSRDDPAASDG